MPRAMPFTGLRTTGPDQLTRTLPDHDRSPPSTASRVLITCHSTRAAQIRAHLPGPFYLVRGTPQRQKRGFSVWRAAHIHADRSPLPTAQESS